jgi:hypothetical protein
MSDELTSDVWERWAATGNKVPDQASRNYSSARGRRTGSGMRGRIAAAAFAMATIFAANVPIAHAFPWSIDIFRGAAVQPLEVAPRVMPDGVLPVDGKNLLNLRLHPQRRHLDARVR